MIHQLQKKSSYIKPEIKKETVKDGTVVRCIACGVDLFGVFRDGELKIQYRGRNVVINSGRVRIICRSCGYETSINLKKVTVNYKVYGDEGFLPKATDGAINLAHEHDILLRNIHGTGKDNQITMKDVQKMIS